MNSLLNCHSSAQEGVSTLSNEAYADEWPNRAIEALEAPSYDVTAMPADVRAPFAVGGVYRFLDIWNRERTALIYTEQHARVDGCWWHVSEVPDKAVCVGTFALDPALVADAARFAREIVNSQEWS